MPEVCQGPDGIIQVPVLLDPVACDPEAEASARVGERGARPHPLGTEGRDRPEPEPGEVRARKRQRPLEGLHIV